MSKQPEALRLATALYVEFTPGNCIRESDIRTAAIELRRLHAECEALRAQKTELVGAAHELLTQLDVVRKVSREDEDWTLLNFADDAMCAAIAKAKGPA